MLTNTRYMVAWQRDKKHKVEYFGPFVSESGATDYADRVGGKTWIREIQTPRPDQATRPTAQA